MCLSLFIVWFFRLSLHPCLRLPLPPWCCLCLASLRDRFVSLPLSLPPSFLLSTLLLSLTFSLSSSPLWCAHCGQIADLLHCPVRVLTLLSFVWMLQASGQKNISLLSYFSCILYIALAAKPYSALSYTFPALPFFYFPHNFPSFVSCLSLSDSFLLLFPSCLFVCIHAVTLSLPAPDASTVCVLCFITPSYVRGSLGEWAQMCVNSISFKKPWCSVVIFCAMYVLKNQVWVCLFFFLHLLMLKTCIFNKFCPSWYQFTGLVEWILWSGVWRYEKNIFVQDWGMIWNKQANIKHTTTNEYLMVAKPSTIETLYQILINFSCQCKADGHVWMWSAVTIVRVCSSVQWLKRREEWVEGENNIWSVRG